MHINTRLTKRVEVGANRIDEEDIETVTTDGGNEVRNARTSGSLLRFEVGFPISKRDNATYLEVRSAFKVCRGSLHSFKFRDWDDYQATDQQFGEGDGTTTVFSLYKNYAFGSESYSRRIYQPVTPIALKKDGVAVVSGYSVSYTTGVVTFSVAPADGAVLTWTGEFDVPVRFDSSLQSAAVAIQLGHYEGLVFKEVRL